MTSWFLPNIIQMHSFNNWRWSYEECISAKPKFIFFHLTLSMFYASVSVAWHTIIMVFLTNFLTSMRCMINNEKSLIMYNHSRILLHFKLWSLYMTYWSSCGSIYHHNCKKNCKRMYLNSWILYARLMYDNFLPNTIVLSFSYDSWTFTIWQHCQHCHYR